MLRRVVAEAPRWLAPGGHLLTETSERQAPQAVETAAASGLIPNVVRSDEMNATVVIATGPAPHRSPGSHSYPERPHRARSVGPGTEAVAG